MNVLCSGELFTDPITTQECLACALKHKGEQPCGYGYRLLKSMFKAFEDDSRLKEIHVTDIVSCLLKAYYDKTNPAARYVHDLLALWVGIAVHSAIDISDAHVTSEVPGEKYDIKYRVDAIYEDGRIEDAKTTRWLVPSNMPYGSHADQVNMYAMLQRGDEEDGASLWIQYIDMSGPTKCRKCKITMRLINGKVTCPKCGYVNENGHLGALMVEIDLEDMADMKDWTLGRKDALTQALRLEIPPMAEPSFLCKGYCPHYQCPHNEATPAE